jgi:hypothetical protein
VSDDLRSFNPDKPVKLPNKKCAYCGVPLRRSIATKDHVVGRRFVPEGTLATGFSLLVQACSPCNNRKASVENFISVITMLPDTSGKYVREDERLTRTVERKARGAISPATRRLAAQSYNKIDARIPLGGDLSLTYQGVGMPTLDDQSVALLAFFHVQGFYHFRSFHHERGYGNWLKSSRFLVLGHFMKCDWGNPQLLHFAAETAAWEITCLAKFADGYFGHLTRKKPNANLCSWVLEWNEQLRVIGLYGDEGEQRSFVDGMPPLSVFSYGDTTNGIAMRYETPIAHNLDDLFATNGMSDDLAFSSPHWRETKPSSD